MGGFCDKNDSPDMRGPERWSRAGTKARCATVPRSVSDRLARLDQRLVAIAADAEPQEVEALIKGDDARLVLVEDQTSGRQPAREPRLDLERLLAGVARAT